MKFRFHEVLGNKEEEFSLIKITRVLEITKDIFLSHVTKL